MGLFAFGAESSNVCDRNSVRDFQAILDGATTAFCLFDEFTVANLGEETTIDTSTLLKLDIEEGGTSTHIDGLAICGIVLAFGSVFAAIFIFVFKGLGSGLTRRVQNTLTELAED